MLKPQLPQSVSQLTLVFQRCLLRLTRSLKLFFQIIVFVLPPLLDRLVVVCRLRLLILELQIKPFQLLLGRVKVTLFLPQSDFMLLLE